LASTIDVVVGHDARVADQQRIADRVRGGERAHVGRASGAERHADHREAPGALGGEALQLGQLGAARQTPDAPEVDQQGMAPEGLESDRPPLQIG